MKTSASDRSNSQPSVLGFVLLASLLLSGCTSSYLRSDPQFVLTSDPIGAPLVGIGAQMNPYLYCRPNWGDVSEEKITALEAKVIALHPQHVRIFTQLDWFAEKPHDWIAKDDPRMRESFIRTVRLAQRAGATVNLSLWFGFWKTPEQSAAKFAAILKELIENEHLTAIQYVTLGNETNAYEDKVPMALYNRCYLALDRELRRVGLREHIKIISGDLVQTSQARWFANLAENLADVSDGYSAHMYWDYWDTEKLMRRVSEVPPIVQSLPPEGQRPLYITEFGVRGFHRFKDEPGYFIDGVRICDTNTQAMQIAWFILEALNRGYVTCVVWDCYDAWYDRLMHYGLIDDVFHHWRTRPAYDVVRLFTHTIEPGWRAVSIERQTARDDLTLAATRGDDGRFAIYALNRSQSEQTFRIRCSSPNEVLFVTATKQKPQVVRADSTGTVRITLPGTSLIALTSIRPAL